MEYMNIGRRFWRSDLAKLTSDQKKPIAKYVQQFREMIRAGVGLYIWGPNGTGKSYVAAALLKHAWRTWRLAGYCVTATQLNGCWIDDEEAHPGSEETVVGRSYSIRLLVVDDLGKEHRTKSGFAETKLSALLRHRSRNQQTTIITTNMNPVEFGKAYSSSTKQLMKEVMHPVCLKGDNMRDVVANQIKGRIGL